MGRRVRVDLASSVGISFGLVSRRDNSAAGRQTQKGK